MATITVPQSFPSDLITGGLNSQRARAAVVEELYRGVVHLTGAAKPTIPLFCSYRALLHGDTITCRVRREFYSKTAQLYILYSTHTPTDNWIISINDYDYPDDLLDPARSAVTLPPTTGQKSSNSKEAVLPFTIGPGLVDDHTLNSGWGDGNQQLIIELLLASRDVYYEDEPKQIYIFSAIIEVDPLSTLEQ